ncbi:MAG: hypothetical protein U1E65_24980 [Myxococcota bacterium]
MGRPTVRILFLEWLDRRFQRWRPPRRVLPTRAGVFALLAPFALGLAAINASNNLLFLVLGAALGLIVLSGITSERMVRDIEAEVRPPETAYAGETAAVLVVLRRTRYRTGRGPIFDLRVRERWFNRRQAPLPKERLEGRLAYLEGREGVVVAERYFRARGLVELAPLELFTRYPLGLLTKATDLDGQARVAVRPRRVEVPLALLAPSGRAIDGERARSTGLGIDVFGLREREERDSAYRVHALRSLAIGREVVVETESLERAVAWLGVWNYQGADPEAFERSLELAQAALLRWEDLGYLVGLATAARRVGGEGGGAQAALGALPTLELEAAAEAPTEGVWLVPQAAPGRAAPAPRGAAVIIEVYPDGSISAPRRAVEAA